jgi:hypothetical protein
MQAQSQRPLRRTQVDESAASSVTGLPSTVSSSWTSYATTATSSRSKRTCRAVLQHEVVESVGRLLDHRRERLSIDQPDALGAGNDARLVGEAHRGVHVLILEGLSIALLQIQQFSFDSLGCHVHLPGVFAS